jgi:hypothetical protein
MAALRGRKGPDVRAAAHDPTMLAVPAPGGASPLLAPPPLTSLSPDVANAGEQPSVASPAAAADAAHLTPSASAPAKRLYRPARRDVADPPVPTVVTPAAPAPRPALPPELAPAEVDPLNRRR